MAPSDLQNSPSRILYYKVYMFLKSYRRECLDALGESFSIALVLTKQVS